MQIAPDEFPIAARPYLTVPSYSNPSRARRLDRACSRPDGLRGRSIIALRARAWILGRILQAGSSTYKAAQSPSVPPTS